MDAFIKRVERTIREERMLTRDARLVVGVSGGADSLALLVALHKLSGPWSLRLTVAHLNHGLRGRESEEDEAYVRNLAQRLSLPVVVKRIKLEPGGSLEARAREARYQFFLETAQAEGAGVIAVGHHGDDVVETVLINLVRGAGSAGLSGIPPVREIKMPEGVFRIIRPLIRERREEIVSFLHRSGLHWREDSMNRDPRFLRNRIRHQLLPLLESYNPAIRETLGRVAEIARRDFELLQVQAQEWLSRGLYPSGEISALSVSDLRKTPLGLRMAIYREALRMKRESLSQISLIHLTAMNKLVESSQAHGRLDLPGLKVIKEYHKLFLEPIGKKSGEQSFSRDEEGEVVVGPFPLPVPGEVRFPGPLGVEYTIRAETNLTREPEEDSMFVVVAAEGVKGKILIRTRLPGDRYQPAGMNGHRKLKKMLSDLRLPLGVRERWPLIVDGEGIIWVPGYRPAERVRLREESTGIRLSISPPLSLPSFGR